MQAVYAPTEEASLKVIKEKGSASLVDYLEGHPMEKWARFSLNDGCEKLATSGVEGMNGADIESRSGVRDEVPGANMLLKLAKTMECRFAKGAFEASRASDDNVMNLVKQEYARRQKRLEPVILKCQFINPAKKSDAILTLKKEKGTASRRIHLDGPNSTCSCNGMKPCGCILHVAMSAGMPMTSLLPLRSRGSTFKKQY